MRVAVWNYLTTKGNNMIRAACFSVSATVACVSAVGVTQRSAEGVLDAYEHVSIRYPSDPNRYVMSRSLAPILVTADDVMEYDLDSNPVDPQGRTSVLDRFIHGEIYKARADVKAVIHSHSPAVVPFGVTQVPMRPLMHVASFLWVGVPVFEIRDVSDPAATGMLVRNATLGKALAVVLDNKPVALMRAHGNVVVGPDVQIAVSR